MNRLFATLRTTIFSEMSALAARHHAVNLGQGFPEEDGAPELRALAGEALLERSNQYAPTWGFSELREALSDHYGRFDGVSLDAGTEVLVTSGATEALAAAFLALIEPGDEVVCFEPLYDAYIPLVERAGGVVRIGRLEPPCFEITAELLERTLTERTKLVVLNTPHNPGASVLDPRELEPLVRHAERFGTTIVSDEVWERVTFDGRKHRSLLSIPGLRERVVKIGSAGKMFSLTGWKVGFVCASPALCRVVSRAHQFLTFSTPPALQVAVATGLRFSREYFESSAQEFESARDRLAKNLACSGFVCLPSAATYFLNVDLRASGIRIGDVEFARTAVEECGVATIPLSAFYAKDPPEHLVRLCFAKRPQTLDEGARRLAAALDRCRG